MRKFPLSLQAPKIKKSLVTPKAGQFEDGQIIMHNGIRVMAGSYGTHFTNKIFVDLIKDNKGVHEPGEEYAFQTVLDSIPEGGTIVELGAWWSFYSMWFCTKVKNANAYMIEPLVPNLEFGKKNFALNKLKGHFFNYFIGKTTGFWEEPKRSLIHGTQMIKTETRTITIDDFLKENNIPFVNILHSDIQAAEVDMLIGAHESISQNKIGYFFISTHSDQLHQECISILKNYKFKILCEVDVTHCEHMDGYIVARAPHIPGPDVIKIG